MTWSALKYEQRSAHFTWDRKTLQPLPAVCENCGKISLVARDKSSLGVEECLIGPHFRASTICQHIVVATSRPALVPKERLKGKINCLE